MGGIPAELRTTVMTTPHGRGWGVGATWNSGFNMMYSARLPVTCSTRGSTSVPTLPARSAARPRGVPTGGPSARVEPKRGVFCVLIPRQRPALTAQSWVRPRTLRPRLGSRGHRPRGPPELTGVPPALQCGLLATGMRKPGRDGPRQIHHGQTPPVLVRGMQRASMDFPG